MLHSSPIKMSEEFVEPKDNYDIGVPPSVHRPADLIPWLEYLLNYGKDIMFGVIYEVYQIKTKMRMCGKRTFYNFCYKDRSSYDDPYHPGCPSPANFCRGTTFMLNDSQWSLVRLPMNRGREIMFIPSFKNLCEDDDIVTEFYSNLIEENQENVPIVAKIDGILLIAFKDPELHDSLKDSPLKNSEGILFGTKGLLSMHDELIPHFAKILDSSGRTIESFSAECSRYLVDDCISLCFEMTGDKRDELVVQYDDEYQDFFFLGASYNDVFKPFYDCKIDSFRKPEIINSTIAQESSKLLGSFPDHIEGSVVWVNKCDMYYPLKLKTLLYYIMHKDKHHEGYHQYLLDLIKEFGWIGNGMPDLHRPITVKTLFAMINFPDKIFSCIPELKIYRDNYLGMSSIKEDPQVLRSQMSKPDFQNWCRFNSIYNKHQYSKAYELDL